MPSFPNDALDPAWCHGDVLLQVCAATGDVVSRTVAELTTAVGGMATIRWRMDGFREENTPASDGKSSNRDLFGFREGTANPDTRDQSLMDTLVWADGTGGEPAWTAGGTYQVIRLIQFAPTLWNAEPLALQEAAIGRRKSDGAPLGHSTEAAAFDYSADPAGQTIALNAHIRRANPRTPQTEGSRILRRGYSYRRDTPQHDEGLIFMCFQRDLQCGFVTVQNRLAGQALDKYVLPFGGGYYFVLPGVDAKPGRYLGDVLVRAGD
ncbi:MAG: deferrochelatase/peroxidase EfeB [Actinomycetota bacterium]|nr:deferrochelatase/peroxidase EfeB [Actinomycetota bacterium]